MFKQFALLLLGLWMVLLSGCMNPSRIAPAPIEDRQQRSAQAPKPRASASSANNPAAPKQAPAPAVVPPSPPTVVSDPAVKSAYYVVKPGDTLIRIGLDHGQNWRDIIRWNAIENPNVIEVGQVLRVLPPTVDTTAEQVIVKPVVGPSQIVNASPETKPVASNPATAPAPPVSAVPDAPEENAIFFWPAAGNISAGFDELKNKGIDIAGKPGDPVYAAADGRVVYAGAGLLSLIHI